jgi:hypothetical protein
MKKNLKKIFIIGAGIFGCSAYIKLKNNFDCTIIDQSKNILEGASTNNLNRVHLGYHYPRDDVTAKQSYLGVKSFCKLYKKAIVRNFNNYYFIAKKSKVNFKNYIKFLERNKLKFKIINLNKFFLNTKNIEGAIKINEPIYDWDLIKTEIKKKITRHKIHLNTKVLKILSKNRGFEIISKNKKFYADIIIDASYWSSNSIFKKKKYEKLKYQITSVYEIKLKGINKLGIAIMDGNFLSFLPKGKEGKTHLYYDVNYSVLKSVVASKFNQDWYNKKKLKIRAFNNIKNIKKKLIKYLPNINVHFLNNNYISPRVFLPNMEKKDRRVSKLIELQKNYFQIISAKVDHSVDIANTLKRKLIKRF